MKKLTNILQEIQIKPNYFPWLQLKVGQTIKWKDEYKSFLAKIKNINLGSYKGDFDDDGQVTNVSWTNSAKFNDSMWVQLQVIPGSLNIKDNAPDYIKNSTTEESIEENSILFLHPDKNPSYSKNIQANNLNTWSNIKILK